MGMRTLLLCVVAAFFVLLAARAARADAGSARRQEARALAKQGLRAFEEGAIQTALDTFERAYLANPDARLLYNIAQCHRQLGERQRAAVMLSLYAAKAPAAKRKEIAALLRDLTGEEDGGMKAVDASVVDEAQKISFVPAL